MNKKQLLEIKKKLLILSLTGVIIGTTGCANNENSDKEPSRIAISSEYSHPEEFYKYAVIDGQATKVYDSSSVYLLFDKETYEVKEYLFKNQFTLMGDAYGGELYDLESEELLAYSDGIATSYNKGYFNYLMENNYPIFLSEVNDYVENYNLNEYCTLEEIRELEPQIVQGLKLINEEKAKTK